MKEYLVILLMSLFITTGCRSSPVTTSSKTHEDSTIFDIIRDHQVLLTNHAEFKKHSELNGASGFLINYNNKVYAVTAKHLIGEAGGVEPEIKVTNLNKYFATWVMYPRVPVNPPSDTVIIANPKLDYSSLNKDLLLLEVANNNFHILPLLPEFNLPQQRDSLYIIGCPYSQEDCKQNLYVITYRTYLEDNAMLVFDIKDRIVLAGFSGAPVVNKRGNVVGMVSSGWKEGKNNYIAATFIKEIQKVK